MLSKTGLEALVAPYLDPRSSIAIAGEGAAPYAEVLARAGAAPLSIEASRFALLSDALNPPAVGRLRDLPLGAVDLVILRRAWSVPADVTGALAAAARVVRPGGEIVAADLDVNRLLAGPNHQYPARLLYLSEASAITGLRASTAAPGLLGAEAVRSGLKEVVGFTYDDELGVYPDIAALWSGIRDRGWRGATWVSAARSRLLFEEVAAAMAGAVSAGWATDREPWYAVIGTRR